jgi:hypothetical protein
LVILTEEALFLARNTARRKRKAQVRFCCTYDATCIVYIGAYIAYWQASSKQDEELIASVIAEYDKDGSGGLNMEELREFLVEAEGGRPSDAELMWVLQMATPAKLTSKDLEKQELRIEHLRAAALAWADYRRHEAEIRTIFNKYDKHNDGDLSTDELRPFVLDLIKQKDSQGKQGTPLGRAAPWHFIQFRSQL